MRYKEPFTLFPRHLKSGKVVWYYQTYNDDGKRTTARSTGEKTKTKARWYCTGLLKAGTLVPRQEKDPLFSSYIKNFFVWGECDYLKYKMTRKSLTPNYAKSARSEIVTHVIPYFKDYRLSRICTNDIEKWITYMQTKNLKNSSINIKITLLSTVFNEAIRRGLIEKNPLKGVQRLSNDSKVKGILTTQEAQKIFDKKKIDQIWGLPVYRILNLISASTGVRLGEAKGICFEDIHDGYIEISKQYKDGYGLTETKTHKSRQVPIPPFLQKDLNEYMKGKKEGDLLLTGVNGDALKKDAITKHLFQALKSIGIDEDERKRRNITFHSWRHFFNTAMRSHNIADSKVQKLTGHSSLQMTEHYTHFQKDDYKDVQKIQEQILNLS